MNDCPPCVVAHLFSHHKQRTHKQSTDEYIYIHTSYNIYVIYNNSFMPVVQWYIIMDVYALELEIIAISISEQRSQQYIVRTCRGSAWQHQLQNLYFNIYIFLLHVIPSSSVENCESDIFVFGINFKFLSLNTKYTYHFSIERYACNGFYTHICISLILKLDIKKSIASFKEREVLYYSILSA